MMNISNFYLCSDLQFAHSLPEKLFSNLFVYMSCLIYLSGLSQMLLHLLIVSDFPWYPLYQWFPSFPSLIGHHSDLGRLFQNTDFYAQPQTYRIRNTEIYTQDSDSHATKTSSRYHSLNITFGLLVFPVEHIVGINCTSFHSPITSILLTVTYLSIFPRVFTCVSQSQDLNS